ncbi:unnamed protein product [Onchocerca flexuosa]|uniref:Uncharacterized protein n=1 Tax=Onchocerca flexuosa TaxID=387005 RepID=A0A183H4Z9_9BILA|nr:unnamed protein product [Onchocerca flexuosa]
MAIFGMQPERSDSPQITPNPPATTLTAFFTICQTDAFAKNCYDPRYYTRNTSEKSFERREEKQLMDNLAYSHKLR